LGRKASSILPFMQHLTRKRLGLSIKTAETRCSGFTAKKLFCDFFIFFSSFPRSFCSYCTKKKILGEDVNSSPRIFRLPACPNLIETVARSPYDPWLFQGFHEKQRRIFGHTLRHERQRPSLEQPPRALFGAGSG